MVFHNRSHTVFEKFEQHVEQMARYVNYSNLATSIVLWKQSDLITIKISIFFFFFFIYIFFCNIILYIFYIISLYIFLSYKEFTQQIATMKTFFFAIIHSHKQILWR